MSGQDQVRGGSGLSIQPPVLSSAFGNVATSTVTRSGYRFQMWLPDSTSAGVSEDAAGGYTGSSIDAPSAETMWCCYAWPSVQGNSGKRAFFINQSGDVLATNGAVVTYNGTASEPTFDAAFASTASNSMSAAIAANTLAHDGNTWVVVQ